MTVYYHVKQAVASVASDFPALPEINSGAPEASRHSSALGGYASVALVLDMDGPVSRNSPPLCPCPKIIPVPKMGQDNFPVIPGQASPVPAVYV